jgi:hypothetical protein
MEVFCAVIGPSADEWFAHPVIIPAEFVQAYTRYATPSSVNIPVSTLPTGSERIHICVAAVSCVIVSRRQFANSLVACKGAN